MSRQGLKARRLQIGGVCLRGHELTGDTIGWREGKRPGDKYILCMECKRARGAKYDLSAAGRVRAVGTRARYQANQNRARLEAAIMAEDSEALLVSKAMKYQNSRVAPHNYLAAKAPEEFKGLNDELDVSRGLCFGRTEWTDYDDPRFPDESTGRDMPTSAEAEAMCAGCPVLDMCRAWAGREKPAWGVHSGDVWVDSKIVTR